MVQRCTKDLEKGGVSDEYCGNRVAENFPEKFSRDASGDCVFSDRFFDSVFSFWDSLCDACIGHHGIFQDAL